MKDDEIRAWRARLALGEAGMAAYLGVPVTTYRKWENGTRSQDASTKRLFDVLQAVEAVAQNLHSELMAAATREAVPDRPKAKPGRKPKGSVVITHAPVGEDDTTSSDLVPSAENLCEDEGCDHHGTPHVCVDPTQPATPAPRFDVLPAWMMGKP